MSAIVIKPAILAVTERGSDMALKVFWVYYRDSMIRRKMERRKRSQGCRYWRVEALRLETPATVRSTLATRTLFFTTLIIHSIITHLTYHAYYRVYKMPVKIILKLYIDKTLNQALKTLL